MSEFYEKRKRGAELKLENKAPKRADTFRPLVEIIHKYFDIIENNKIK